MDFRSAYRHGFLRVAACTLRTALADPATNAETVIAAARACHDEGVGLAVFPELTLSGYSIEDILQQDTLLDEVQRALLDVVAASAELLPVLVVGAPLRYRHRIYNTAVVVHRGRVLGVAPKSYLPTYREFYERRQVAVGDDISGTIRIGGGVGGGVVRTRPAVHRGGRARVRAARGDLRGHVGADPAQRRGRAGRGHRAGEPVRQPDHGRACRRPPAALPVRLVTLPGRVRLRGRRRG
jgi:hypothetical protein